MIKNETIRDLVKYFESKETRTEQETAFLEELSLFKDIYPITGVAKADLEPMGFDVEKITDDDMDWLARKMSDDYCNQLFWESLEILAEDFPKRPLKVVKVDWNTDDEEVDDLPTEVEIPYDVEEEDIADWLSDEYGWCVNSWVEVTND